MNLRGGSAVEIRTVATIRHRLAEILERRAVENAEARDGGGVREQHRLHVDLVDAVWRLGCRPLGVGSAGRGVAVAPAGNRIRDSSMPVAVVR